MSNTAAIAAVTATIKSIIEDATSGWGGLKVTTKPPDRVRVDEPADQVNLFLYRTSVATAFANSLMPFTQDSGEPLALNLHYLVTAYGRDDNDLRAHQLLGMAMSVLHDWPVLDRARLRDTVAAGTDADAFYSDLGDQIERVRVTSVELTIEEISKLWSAFTVGCRVSAAYQASVVLIDSTAADDVGLPVLMRGDGDIGPTVIPDPKPTGVVLRELKLVPASHRTRNAGGVAAISTGGITIDSFVSRKTTRPAAIANDVVTILADNLPGQGVEVALTHPVRDTVPCPSDPVGVGKISFSVPPDLPAGTVGVRLVSTATPPTFVSSERTLSIAPQVTRAKFGTGAKRRLLTVTVTPRVLPGQHPLLIVDGTVLQPEATPQSPTDSLVFDLTEVPAGAHHLRLRVEGVDSRLLTRDTDAGAGDHPDPPAFVDNATTRVTVPDVRR